MNENAPRPEHHTAADLFPDWLRRFLPLLAVVTISVATVGFISGIREPAPTARPSPDEDPPTSPAPAAVDYADLPGARLKPNARGEQLLSQLQFARPGLFDTVTRTEEMKLAALADRARNRAYDGAPPTIPHPVTGHTAAACLACHGDGIKVGERIASKMSHAHLSNCTQCHVEQARSTLTGPTEPAENSFIGLYRAGPGDRANPGAPPTIPHHTWMRENCMSCHGLVTRPGTRTTHPWLSNCTQCHAASSARDRLPFSGDSR